MKSFKLIALAAAVAGISPVFAQSSASTNVSVGVTVTSKCEFTSSPLAWAAGSTTYTAFQTTDLVDSKTATIKCTRGATAPSFLWNGGTAGALTTLGTTAGLTYQLKATLGTFTSGSAPTGSSLTDLGTPDTANVTVELTIPKDQAGTNGVGTAAARSLTVSF